MTQFRSLAHRVLLAVGIVASLALVDAAGASDLNTTPGRIVATDAAKGAGAGPIAIRQFIGEPIDTACYRTTISTDPKTKKCAAGYNGPIATRCWSECPIEYPVQCGFECVPQGGTCTKAMLNKGAAIAGVVADYLGAGLYTAISAQITHWATCAKAVQPVFEAVGQFVEKKKNATAVEVTSSVGRKLVPAIKKCLDIDLDMMAKQAADELLTDIVDGLIKLIGETDGKKIDKDAVKNLLTHVLSKRKPGTQRAFASKNHGSLSQATKRGNNQQLYQCGVELMAVMDKIADEVRAFPDGTDAEQIKAAVESSQEVLLGVPDSVFKCVGVERPELYSKAVNIVSAMVSKVVDHMIAQKLTKTEAGLVLLDAALEAISKFDPTGLADLAQEFVQPVCGPTIFTQAIQYGGAEETVGLEVHGYAFHGSTGRWVQPRSVDEAVTIHVSNQDSTTVTMYVMSAGLTVDKFQVKSKSEATWTSKKLEGDGKSVRGKTLHVVRERVKFWAFDELAGGSLLAWVPKDPGHLELNVKIHPPAENIKAAGMIEVEAAETQEQSRANA